VSNDSKVKKLIDRIGKIKEGRDKLIDMLMLVTTNNENVYKSNSRKRIEKNSY
jgi:hypothetical protein